MALYRYFCSANDDRKLPDPRGPLSKTIPSSAIASANFEIKALTQSEGGQYAKLTPELRFEVGKRAAEHGVAATIRYYSTKFNLKESSVRTWRNAYTGEIRTRRRDGGDVHTVVYQRRREAVLCF